MKHRISVIAVAIVASVASLAAGYFQRSMAGRDMTKNAQAYLATLNEEQRGRGLLAYDAAERVDWHFIPKPTRKGVQVREMNGGQRAAANALLRSALSQIGYGKAAAIMELEKLLHELEKGRQGGQIRDPERYFVTLFGKPGDSERWGLSFEGHHLSLNFVVEQGKVVSSSPMAFGVNPATIKSDVAGGPKLGSRIIAKEETLAFDLLHALSAEQKKVAVIAAEAIKEVRAAGEPHPPATAPEGISAEKLDAKQAALLKQLVEAYAENMPEDVAEDRLNAISQAGWNKLHFAWTGAEQPGTGHYYRIQGPTFLIEFVNTQPDAAGNPANHIHCVWRDPNGDFAITRAAK